MFCEKCGAENPNDAKFCASCGHEFKRSVVIATGEKSMILALIISFFLSGLGIAYAGNVKKGALLFVASLVFYILGMAIGIFAIVGILIWAYGLYETYNQVETANGVENPNLIEDWKSWQTPKKIGVAFVVIIILLCVVGSAINALTPDNDYSSADRDYKSSSSNLNHTSTGSDSSSSSGSSSSGSSSYSSSKNGHDVSSHYEGEYGSADTHGTVYDDGSVESHQTGHTDYGDYKVDSYMDSSGNIHGTVDVGGKTYHISG